MNEPIKTFKVNDLTVKIYQDELAESPRGRDYCDYQTKFVAFHRRYDLGDKHSFDSPEALAFHIEATDAIALPVYLIDHSGLSVSTGAFGCPWDSGQVGMIFMERDTILKEYNVKRISPKVRAQVLKRLEAEIEEYDQYLTGDVYGYVIERAETCGHCEHTEMTELDSCWGFYGMEYCEEEAKSAAECESKDASNQTQAIESKQV